MTEAQEFYSGGVDLPLTSSVANSLLRDADPAVYYALEFYAQVLETHLRARLVAEAAAVGATQVASAVAETLPIDPEQYITEEHLKFPLLTLHRESTSYKYLTKRRVAIHKLKLAYVLPPLRAAEAERLLPILHLVGNLIDQKTVQGLDPAYTPSAPTGTAGEFVWSSSRAGVAKVEVKDSTTGAFQISSDLFFPAIVMSLEMWELADSDFRNNDTNNGGTSAYPELDGADVQIDLRQDSDDSVLEDFVDFNLTNT